MNILIFGLSVSSAWGNGHATLLRGLFRALHNNGHKIDFFERDVPYYAAHRDAPSLPYADLHFYSDWSENLSNVRAVLAHADVAMVTSYCPDGAAAGELILNSKASLRKVFYDMDTPVTLTRLHQGETVPYIPASGLSDFDLVLSYTGGDAIGALHNKLGAKNVTTLYGWVDPEIHHRVAVCPDFSADLSYLGTYSADRQGALEELLIRPARSFSDRSFIIGGAMYPNAEDWPANIRYCQHVAPPQHSSFYSSSPLTLSVTRGVMASMGFCPSGRLFEAAACGTAVLSDWWTGLDTFFQPGEEILIGVSSSDAIAALTSDRAYLERIGSRAKERALDCHTAQVRARRLINLIEQTLPAGTESNTPALAAKVS